jgi:hypothetical protein
MRRPDERAPADEGGMSGTTAVLTSDEKYGEEIMTWVILKRGEDVTIDQFRVYCHGHISLQGQRVCFRHAWNLQRDHLAEQRLLRG